MPSAAADKPKAPDMEAIKPSSRSLVFSPRPVLNTGGSFRSSHGKPTASKSFRIPPQVSASNISTVMLVANPNLTSVEVESIIRQKVADNSDAIKRAFQVYDAERFTNVTKGEFRRVLDNYCIPLTTEQFNSLLNKINVNPNGTISYTKFLERFSEKYFTPPAIPLSKSANVIESYARGESNTARESTKKQPMFNVCKASQEQSIDAIERHLQHKIAGNLQNIVKAFRLFDYNRDGQIQRHELRRVLENYCLKLKDSQFDKLWSRYDFHHVGAIDYRDFLRRLGVNAAAAEKQLLSQNLDPETDDAPWDAKKKRLEREKEVTDLVLKRNKEKKQMRSKRIDDMTFAQVEKEFREKMRVNYENIERAMLAFDYASDGFIAIEDLKAVLDNFVLPTTDEVFHQLMYKFEVRGTGKVSWEQFLHKFQDPQGVGNGQTLPLGQNHKVNPMRQGLNDASVPEVLTKLKKHVLSNFSSLKQAFLAYDENRKGVINRRDLRRIVESFTLKLSDESFKELCTKLDPGHTGLIRYHDFLDLFEPKESISAHKWLNSNHKVNMNQPPAILAWDTVEEILREKLSENYRKVADEYAALDTIGKGTITKAQLRRLLDRYALPVSDEHFSKMWNNCEEVDKSRIMFAHFLANLGIDVQPGDLEGTSTRIHDQSNAAEMQRMEDHQFRVDDIDRVNMNHTRVFSAAEVIRKLKERMSLHDTGIRKSFLRYSKSGKGKVTRKDLRKMLEEMGFMMDDVQFKEFLDILKCNQKGLDYSDFIAGFQDLRVNGMGQELERAGNHVVNKTHTKYMTAEECYIQILERMRQNYGSVRSAFFKVDDDHDGILTMHEFRRLLDSFMFIITDETFHELLRMLGLTRKSLLSYYDFIQKFEVVDKAEGHPWLNSQHRFNKVRKESELTASKVHQCLCLKAEQAWSDMVKTFQNFDADGNGVVTKRDLRALLYRFILPMSDEQFQILWKRYDEDGKGFITHQDFVKKLGRTLVPGDDLGLQGTSRKMIEENYDNVKNHHEFQQAKHKELALNQAKLSQHLTAETVERELKDRFREYYADFDKAFRQLDKNKDGYITIADLQRVLLQLNYFLDEEQFLALLRRLGLPTTRARLSYFDFLRAIDDGRASKFGHRRKGSGYGRKEQVTWQTFDHLTAEKAIMKLKDKVTVNYDSINSAFRAFDRAQTGLINVTDFRRILDSFCFRLTDKQFKAVLGKCKISTGWSSSSNKTVNWIVFLQDFSFIKDTKLKEWTDYVGKAAPQQSPAELSYDEIEERLREVVSGRYNAVCHAFADADYAKIYVVSKDNFREILHENVMRMSDEQFDRLWAQQAVNEFNNLEYREFLKKYNVLSDDKLPPRDSIDTFLGKNVENSQPNNAVNNSQVNELSPGKANSRPASADSHFSSRSLSNYNVLERVSSPLVNAESAEAKIKHLVYRHWQDIQRECRKLDINKTGSILPDEFVGILDRFGVMLSIEEARRLMQKYDIGETSGMFNYREFLRHFILNLKPSEEGILKRRKIAAGKLPIDTGKERTGFVEAMLKLREKILLSWKEMRRTFKMVDHKADGFVSSAVFRQVLRQFMINLSEEDFYHLLSFYDPKMRGRVPYNDFIRAFLQ